MEIVEWIIIGMAIFFGIQYLFAPIIVFWSQKLPENYSFNLLESEKFLSERTPVFIELHKEIQDSGFEYIGSSELIMSNASMYFSIYNNFSKKIACTLVTAQSVPVKSTYIEFTQMYKNGSVLNVSNAPIINVYPKSEYRLSFRFPMVNDFGQLLELAEKLINSNKQSEEKITFIRGDEFKTVESYLNRELSELIERDWVQSIITAGHRRLTVKGALLMTWKMLWPIKQILNKIDISRSHRAIENP